MPLSLSLSLSLSFSVRAAAFLTAAALCSGSAAADSLYRDQVSADSFGNLVIYSQAGYKRIVVGAGELAGKLQDYGAGQPGDGLERDEGRGYGPTDYDYGSYRGCHRGSVLLHGRSYMYGVPTNVTPVVAGPCD